MQGGDEVLRHDNRRSSKVKRRMEDRERRRNDDFFSYYFVFVEEKRQKKVWRKNAYVCIRNIHTYYSTTDSVSDRHLHCSVLSTRLYSVRIRVNGIDPVGIGSVKDHYTISYNRYPH